MVAGEAPAPGAEQGDAMDLAMTNPDVADLAATVQRLADLEAIRALKMRYTRFCDDGYDPEGIASLFVEDGVWDGQALFGRCQGHEAIKAHFREAPGRVPWALHNAVCPEIEIASDGMSARGTWYLWQPCQRQRRGGVEQAYLAGTYADTYTRTPAGWRFATVLVDARWLEAPPPGTAPASLG